MGPFVVLRAHLEKWMRKPAMDVNHTSGKMEAGWKNNARPATNRRNAIRRAEANAEWGALQEL